MQKLTGVKADEPKGVLPVEQGPWGHVFLGDCREIAGELPLKSLDLVYLDPPFFTNREHKGNGKVKMGKLREARNALGFDDRWVVREGKVGYLRWLEERIRAIRSLLTPTGVFLLHLDWHVVHYAKVLCDGIFGEERFQNELIWYYQTGGASKDRFSRKHDTILLYSNGETFPFNGKAIAIPRTAKAMERAKCPTGARIKATNTHKNPDDVLVIPALNPMANERTGYPTQKPVELLERLIKALTPEQGTVGDFCCGSGTTLVAAQRLGRRWVGCDVNPAAVELARWRVKKS
ncbi:MAG: site-specific DNA-methyltransferase [Phycisphaerales bacterium]|nr:site-specific DNA-methyltransferase [Phycisphaerales bacterium]